MKGAGTQLKSEKLTTPALRATLFLFAAERRLESFAMRPLPPDGVAGSGWTVTVEGTDSQPPEDSDTLTAM